MSRARAVLSQIYEAVPFKGTAEDVAALVTQSTDMTKTTRRDVSRIRRIGKMLPGGLHKGKMYRGLAFTEKGILKILKTGKFTARDFSKVRKIESWTTRQSFAMKFVKQYSFDHPWVLVLEDDVSRHDQLLRLNPAIVSKLESTMSSAELSKKARVLFTDGGMFDKPYWTEATGRDLLKHLRQRYAKQYEVMTNTKSGLSYDICENIIWLRVVSIAVQLAKSPALLAAFISRVEKKMKTELSRAARSYAADYKRVNRDPEYEPETVYDNEYYKKYYETEWTCDSRGRLTLAKTRSW